MPRQLDRRGVWVGTSGWSYQSWRGPFYPIEVPKKDWLSWYGTQFASTEINGSFYRTPSVAAVRAWRKNTPKDFLFAWKASKFITHWKRLDQDTCANSITLLVSRLNLLGPKLGPVLFQLPANFEADCRKLTAFLRLLPRRFRYAFEFRHSSWYDAAVLRLLREQGVSLCISDHHHARAPWIATARHVYVRGHGPGGRYKDNYPDPALGDWADQICKWRRQGRIVFVYFDNDQKSAAPRDAQRLLEMLAAAGIPSHEGRLDVRECARRSTFAP
jgi:uncharacterized protein YecE (DUF72 family)